MERYLIVDSKDEVESNFVKAKDKTKGFFYKTNIDIIYSFFEKTVIDEFTVSFKICENNNDLTTREDYLKAIDNLFKIGSPEIPSIWFTDVLLDCLFTLDFFCSTKKEKEFDENDQFAFDASNQLFPKLITSKVGSSLYYADLHIDQMHQIYKTQAKTTGGFYKKFNLFKAVVSDEIFENYLIEKTTHAGYIYNAKELLNAFHFIDKSPLKLKTIKITDYGVEHEISLSKYLQKAFEFKGTFCRVEILKLICEKISSLEHNALLSQQFNIFSTPPMFNSTDLQALELTAKTYLNNEIYTKVRKKFFYDICKEYYILHDEDYMNSLRLDIESLLMHTKHSKISSLSYIKNRELYFRELKNIELRNITLLYYDTPKNILQINPEGKSEEYTSENDDTACETIAQNKQIEKNVKSKDQILLNQLVKSKKYIEIPDQPVLYDIFNGLKNSRSHHFILLKNMIFETYAIRSKYLYINTLFENILSEIGLNENNYNLKFEENKLKEILISTKNQYLNSSKNTINSIFEEIENCVIATPEDISFETLLKQIDKAICENINHVDISFETLLKQIDKAICENINHVDIDFVIQIKNVFLNTLLVNSNFTEDTKNHLLFCTDEEVSIDISIEDIVKKPFLSNKYVSFELNAFKEEYRSFNFIDNLNNCILLENHKYLIDIVESFLIFIEKESLVNKFQEKIAFLEINQEYNSKNELKLTSKQHIEQILTPYNKIYNKSITESLINIPLSGGTVEEQQIILILNASQGKNTDNSKRKSKN
ncbi:MAG: hypothetical protein R3Y09_01315 [Clostridia bacterium]